MDHDTSSIIAKTTARIAVAYVTKNVLPPDGVPNLVALIGDVLSHLAEPEVVIQEPPIPAVSVKKSVTHEYLICLEDGQKFKSLKRHLGAKYGMTPEQYRQKWSLPTDYPMVAPAYARVRSLVAFDMGLGRSKD